MKEIEQIDRVAAAEAFMREGAVTALSALRQYPDAMAPDERSAITAACLMREWLTAVHASETETLRARITELETAASALVEQCEAMGEATGTIFAEMANVRGRPYRGPMIGDHIDAMRAVLNKRQGGKP